MIRSGFIWLSQLTNFNTPNKSCSTETVEVDPGCIKIEHRVETVSIQSVSWTPPATTDHELQTLPSSSSLSSSTTIAYSVPFISSSITLPEESDHSHQEYLEACRQNETADGKDSEMESPCPENTPFLWSMIHHIPEELAQQMTEHDVLCFGSFCRDDFLLDNSKHLKNMNSQWNKLHDDVKACLATRPGLVEPTCQVIKFLFRVKNHYSGMALLLALHTTEYRPEALHLQDLWTLVSWENNYATYRKLYSDIGGLPFLTPLVRQIEIAKALSKIGGLSRPDQAGKELLNLFKFVSYNGWQRCIKDEKHRPETAIFGLCDSFCSLVSPLLGLRQCLEGRPVSVDELPQSDSESFPVDLKWLRKGGPRVTKKPRKWTRKCCSNCKTCQKNSVIAATNRAIVA